MLHRRKNIKEIEFDLQLMLEKLGFLEDNCGYIRKYNSILRSLMVNDLYKKYCKDLEQSDDYYVLGL